MHLDSASTFVCFAQRVADFFLEPYRLNNVEREQHRLRAETVELRAEVGELRGIVSALRADVARLIGQSDAMSGVWQSVGQSAITSSHPSGFSARLKTTYADQEGKFKLQRPSGVVLSGADDFWITDASISYRLPKRMGIIMIDAINLFNQSFNYQEIDTNNPSIQPERAVFAKFTLAF